MNETRNLKSLQAELERRDRQLFDMRIALIESRLSQLEDHEARLRLLEQKITESRTVLSIAFGSGILSLGNLVMLWLR
jgi:hypothetical protein